MAEEQVSRRRRRRGGGGGEEGEGAKRETLSAASTALFPRRGRRSPGGIPACRHIYTYMYIYIYICVCVCVGRRAHTFVKSAALSPREPRAGEV